ncbi:hypothetical protein BU26DRAFT_576565 [Trematosphaeria pertusa]|uniref:Uncharacterized protein n=1 Tax=Trematosphaeria pertusa TaxID=390896 RepID=A0A6A6I8Y6_9PLEO|nr:uncharacterized protein BU26DRAFT_576565 [Trematosphaeria pertusa]KAF2246679.1 hypothetical protein BU26DRAFT_576565 [Trematosphaeria pertusa]
MFSLLKVLWARPGPKLDISFIYHPTRAQSRGYHCRSKGGVGIDRLNQMLEALVCDVLGLKKFWRSIQGIFVARDGSRGWVTYRSSTEDSDFSWHYSCKEFRVEDASGGLSVAFVEPKPTLVSLPRQTLNLISRLVTQGNNATVDIDIDRGTLTGVSPALLAVNRQLRTSAEPLFQDNHFRVKMTSDTCQTTFNGFEALRKWVCTRRSGSYPWAPQSLRHLTLILHFETDEAEKLADISIGITELVRVLGDVPQKDVNICFSLSRKLTGKDCKSTTTTTISLKALRLKALIALHQIARKYPYLKHHRCPDLWMNGLGKITDATRLFPTPVLRSTLYDIYKREKELSLLRRFGWRYSSAFESPVTQHCDGSLGNYLGYLRRVLCHPGVALDYNYWAKSYSVPPSQ